MKVNGKTKDYCVFKYESKSGTFGEILESKLSKEEAMNMCGKLGSGHMFSKTSVYQEFKNNQNENNS